MYHSTFQQPIFA